jgi:hypothetical protein
MRKKHGNYYDGKKRYCSTCNKLIGAPGWNRHQEVHLPGGAGPLKAKVNSPEKNENFVTSPVETPIVETPIESYSSNVSKEDIELAFNLFPYSPMAFNAVTFLAAAAKGIDPVENLKTAFIYLDLEIQAREGWED